MILGQNGPQGLLPPTSVLAPPLPWKRASAYLKVRPTDHAKDTTKDTGRACGTVGSAGGGVWVAACLGDQLQDSRAGLRVFGEKPPITLALTFTNSVQSLSLDFVLIHKGHSLSNFAPL